MDVTPIISIDPHNFYNFFPLFLSLPDLTTEVNSFDDLKNMYFLLNRLRMLHELFTHCIFGHQ